MTPYDSGPQLDALSSTHNVRSLNNSFLPPGILAKLTHGRGYCSITCISFMLKTDWLGDPPIPNDDQDL